MGKKRNLNGPLKNLHRMVEEVRDFAALWPADKADQPGWTHQYMQRCRTFARTCPVIVATFIGLIVIPAACASIGTALVAGILYGVTRA